MTWQSWQVFICCVVGTISILGSIVTVTAVIIQMRANISRLQDSDEQRLKKEEALDKQVLEMFMVWKEFVGRQAEVNINVAAQLKQQIEANEKVAQALKELATTMNDMGTRLKLVEHASNEGGQIISLLTEALNRTKVISQE